MNLLACPYLYVTANSLILWFYENTKMLTHFNIKLRQLQHCITNTFMNFKIQFRKPNSKISLNALTNKCVCIHHLYTILYNVIRIIVEYIINHT